MFMLLCAHGYSGGFTSWFWSPLLSVLSVLARQNPRRFVLGQKVMSIPFLLAWSKARLSTFSFSCGRGWTTGLEQSFFLLPFLGPEASFYVARRAFVPQFTSPSFFFGRHEVDVSHCLFELAWYGLITQADLWFFCLSSRFFESVALYGLCCQHHREELDVWRWTKTAMDAVWFFFSYSSSHPSRSSSYIATFFFIYIYLELSNRQAGMI